MELCPRLSYQQQLVLIASWLLLYIQRQRGTVQQKNSSSEQHSQAAGQGKGSRHAPGQAQAALIHKPAFVPCWRVLPRGDGGSSEHAVPTLLAISLCSASCPDPAGPGLKRPSCKPWDWWVLKEGEDKVAERWGGC